MEIIIGLVRKDHVFPGIFKRDETLPDYASESE
jgi:hypothetical protein